MSKSRVIDYHLSRLNDRRPSVRLDAIQELLLLNSTEVLDKLKEIYEQDDDPEVRKAAQVAGREIFLKNQGTQQG